MRTPAHTRLRPAARRGPSSHAPSSALCCPALPLRDTGFPGRSGMGLLLGRGHWEPRSPTRSLHTDYMATYTFAIDTITYGTVSYFHEGHLDARTRRGSVHKVKLTHLTPRKRGGRTSFPEQSTQRALAVSFLPLFYTQQNGMMCRSCLAGSQSASQMSWDVDNDLGNTGAGLFSRLAPSHSGSQSLVTSGRLAHEPSDLLVSHKGLAVIDAEH